MLSVFTPTYNRAYTLGRLYDSLVCQQDSAGAFEWVIVDDGSTDETSKLVEQWSSNPKTRFAIRYIHQKNQGKHVAWNTALAHVSGELFLPIDSDDYFVPDAFKQVVGMLEKTVGQDNLIGFSGVRMFPGNKPTGGKLNNPTVDYIDYCSTDRRSKGISGDLAEVFFTDIIRRYPFPVYEDEKFVPEAVIFNRFSEDGYLIRGFGKPLYYCEYLSDGYTKHMDSLLIRNWKGYSLYVHELMHCHSNIISKIMPIGGYVYRSLLRRFHQYR